MEAIAKRTSPLPQIVKDIRALFKDHPNTIRVFVDKYKCPNGFNIHGYRIKVQVATWAGFLTIRHRLSIAGFRMVSDEVDGPVRKKYFLIERA